jgi:hypothetical protein
MRVVTSFLFLIQLSAVAFGQVKLSNIGSAYVQDFNSLASSDTSSLVPSGWTFHESGDKADTTYVAGTGSSNYGNTYSFGLAASTDRALGTLQSATLIPVFGASFQNKTIATIKSLQISYVGEQWRCGATGRQDRLDFQYSTDATSLTDGNWIDVDLLDFASPSTTSTGALNGNDPANRDSISATISGLNIASGATFWIRWSDFNATSSDDGLAVDDFSLTPLTSEVPLRVVMRETSAKAEQGRVMLTFSTSSELGIAGFNISRAIEKAGPFDLISGYLSNPALRAHGEDNFGADYAFADLKALPGKTYYYKIESVSETGVSEQEGSILTVSVETPEDFVVFQNFPNPFNPLTAIGYRLSAPSRVTLRVYDAAGREVALLVDALQSAGAHSATFDGSGHASGVYIYRLESESLEGQRNISVKKMIFVK